MTARASANDAAEAVVRAVLAATGSTLEFRETRETPINGTRAVLVVLSDERGVPRPGFVVSEDDLLQVTATATLARDLRHLTAALRARWSADR